MLHTCVLHSVNARINKHLQFCSLFAGQQVRVASPLGLMFVALSPMHTADADETKLSSLDESAVRTRIRN